MRILKYFTLAIVIFGCQPTDDRAAMEVFEKNAQTIRAYLKSVQNESIDYQAFFAENAIVRGTGFGVPDTVTIDQVQAQDKLTYQKFDFELVTDPLVLLPGVNVETKRPDGSVRYYGDWRITLSATDSTEARSGILKLYESFDFNEEGKITFQQYYGDLTGLFLYLAQQDSI